MSSGSVIPAAVAVMHPFRVVHLAAGVPTALDEVISLARTLKKRPVDVLVYFDMRSR